MKKNDDLNVKTLRILAVEAVEKAKSGHPGLPLGAAPMAYTLWAKHLKHNPANSKWLNRDRFILSAGHGSALLYSLLHVFGYRVSMNDILNFRQLGSNTPGHPEYGHTDGLEATTGPLGQGIANAVGSAIAEVYLREKFNREDYPVVDHFTYAIAGDGCLMEGVSSEASSLAGTLGLGKLIVLYDSNNITIEGRTELAFREDAAQRYEAYGWQVLTVEDGNDLEEIDEAIKEGKRETRKPTLIIVKTIIGYGSPAKQGTAAAHGEPLGSKELQAVKDFYGWKYPDFVLPEEVKAFREENIKKGQETEKKWQELFEKYQRRYPELAEELLAWFSEEDRYGKDILNEKSFWSFDKDLSTREASGICIEKLTKIVPNIIGGSADLAPSNKTYMKERGDFSPENYRGANLHFGVREHAMSAIANGIALHGGLKIFAGTFFVFTDYMKAGMRLSAMMKLPITYVLTHDSIGLGEDGPTHQPVEHLAALRAMPDMVTFRPADANETAVGWYYAISQSKLPVALILSRQKLPILDGTGRDALKGAYIIRESKKKDIDLIIAATGSEVALVLEAAEELTLKGFGIRVVSFPSFELFEQQDADYKEQVFPNEIRKRLAVEAGSSFGWHKYVGLDGQVISIDSFGASGNSDDLFESFGFTKENVIEKSIGLMSD